MQSEIFQAFIYYNFDEFHQGTGCLFIIVFQAGSREEAELAADWLTPRAWWSLTFKSEELPVFSLPPPWCWPSA